METNKQSHFQRSLVMSPAQSHHPKDLMLWLNYSLALPWAEEAEPLPACLDNSVLLCLPVMGKRRRILRKSLSFQFDLCWGFHCLFFSQEMRNFGIYHLPHFLTFAYPSSLNPLLLHFCTLIISGPVNSKATPWSPPFWSLCAFSCLGYLPAVRDKNWRMLDPRWGFGFI